MFNRGSTYTKNLIRQTKPQRKSTSRPPSHPFQRLDRPRIAYNSERITVFHAIVYVFRLCNVQKCLTKHVLAEVGIVDPVKILSITRPSESYNLRRQDSLLIRPKWLGKKMKFVPSRRIVNIFAVPPVFVFITTCARKKSSNT